MARDMQPGPVGSHASGYLPDSFPTTRNTREKRMKSLVMIGVPALALVLGAGAFAAQEATPAADSLPGGLCASPVASPAATPVEVVLATPGVDPGATPEASPTTLYACATPAGS